MRVAGPLEEIRPLDKYQNLQTQIVQTFQRSAPRVAHWCQPHPSKVQTIGGGTVSPSAKQRQSPCNPPGSVCPLYSLLFNPPGAPCQLPSTIDTSIHAHPHVTHEQNHTNQQHVLLRPTTRSRPPLHASASAMRARGWSPSTGAVVGYIKVHAQAISE